MKNFESPLELLTLLKSDGFNDYKIGARITKKELENIDSAMPPGF